MFDFIHSTSLAKIWIIWLVVNGLGLALIVACGAIINFSISPTIGWIVSGGVLSYVQQTTYRDLLPPRWGWVSLLGWTVGILLGRWMNGWYSIGWDLNLAVLGLSVGGGQWFSFKNEGRNAFGWIVVSGAGFVLAGSLGGATLMLESWFMFKGLIDVARTLTEPLGYVLGGLVGGAVYGAVSGGWLIYLTQVTTLYGEDL